METFIKNDIEVLLFTDPVDEFWIPNISEYKKCSFKSITKGNIDIDKYKDKKIIRKMKKRIKRKTKILIS